MEVDSEVTPAMISTSSNADDNSKQIGADSDDETLKFEQDDDLYGSDLDEVDAQWAKKQHRPAAECEKKGSANGGHYDDNTDDDGSDLDDDANDGSNGDRHRRSRPEFQAHIGDTPADGTGNAGGTKPLGHGQQQEERQPHWKPQRPQAPKRRVGDDAIGVESDAQLSCPLCFTTVCLECQRHARYQNQFRAVTGINIVIDDGQPLTLDQVSGSRNQQRKTSGKGGRKGGQAAQQQRSGKGADLEEVELFRAVCCSQCEHRVGVLDEDDVFHFFNVIASG